MTSASLSDVERQMPESELSKEMYVQVDAVTDDWDEPDNKENPRNWSACKSLLAILEPRVRS